MLAHRKSWTDGQLVDLNLKGDEDTGEISDPWDPHPLRCRQSIVSQPRKIKSLPSKHLHRTRSEYARKRVCRIDHRLSLLWHVYLYTYRCFGRCLGADEIRRCTRAGHGTTWTLGHGDRTRRWWSSNAQRRRVTVSTRRSIKTPLILKS
jgi:hypothetical protein